MKDSLPGGPYATMRGLLMRRTLLDDAIAAYAEEGDAWADCRDFVILATFTGSVTVIDFSVGVAQIDFTSDPPVLAFTAGPNANVEPVCDALR